MTAETATLTNWPLASMIEELAAIEAEQRAADQAMKEARDHLKAVGDRAQDQRDRIRELLQSEGVMSDKTPLAKVSIAKTPPKLKIDDPETIPGEFYDMEPSLNSARLKARVMSGIPVAGVSIEQSETLKVEWVKK